MSDEMAYVRKSVSEVLRSWHWLEGNAIQGSDKSVRVQAPAFQRLSRDMQSLRVAAERLRPRCTLCEERLVGGDPDRFYWACEPCLDSAHRARERLKSMIVTDCPPISVRTASCLSKAIDAADLLRGDDPIRKALGRIAAMSDGELLEQRNFGKKMLSEARAGMAQYLAAASQPREGRPS